MTNVLRKNLLYAYISIQSIYSHVSSVVEGTD